MPDVGPDANWVTVEVLFIITSEFLPVSTMVLAGRVESGPGFASFVADRLKTNDI